MSKPLRSDPVQRLRQEAWAFGRDLRDRLLREYQQAYGVEIPPPPAIIIDELLTDFLGADLRYDPLTRGPFAQTQWLDGRPVVTINTLTKDMQGVKDADGVENVGKWHEGIHVVRDMETLRPGPQPPLPGFDLPATLVCYRKPETSPRTHNMTSREFWAEEAGRAAAVCFAALGRSKAFRALIGPRRRSNAEMWRLLYEAAWDIGVNRSALVTQLGREGRIVVQEENGRKVLYIQASLTTNEGVVL
jgi:hypothetical protein